MEKGADAIVCLSKRYFIFILLDRERDSHRGTIRTSRNGDTQLDNDSDFA